MKVLAVRHREHVPRLVGDDPERSRQHELGRRLGFWPEEALVEPRHAVDAHAVLEARHPEDKVPALLRVEVRAREREDRVGIFGHILDHRVEDRVGVELPFFGRGVNPAGELVRFERFANARLELEVDREKLPEHLDIEPRRAFKVRCGPQIEDVSFLAHDVRIGHHVRREGLRWLGMPRHPIARFRVRHRAPIFGDDKRWRVFRFYGSGVEL